VGNKRDLKKRDEGPKKQDFKKLEGVRIKEVSALTNQGVNELFKNLIKEIHENPVLHMKIHNQQKQKNREDDFKEVEDTSKPPSHAKKTPMLFGMIPFACGGARDD
jgi:tRNA U34 5-carboxymethylaminomethyl modifying GTPase MnmE/TrmE